MVNHILNIRSEELMINLNFLIFQKIKNLMKTLPLNKRKIDLSLRCYFHNKDWTFPLKLSVKLQKRRKKEDDQEKENLKIYFQLKKE